MSDFQMMKIKEICEKVSVGYVGSTTKYFTTRENGIPFLRSKNIRLGKIDMKDLVYVTKEFHHKTKKSQLQKGDIVIVRVGQNRGDVCKISDEFEEMNVANCVFLRPPIKYSDYLEILLRSQYGQKLLLSISTGSAQEVLNTGAIAELEVPIPNDEMILYTSKTINGFDNKISLLETQNKTLEAIAQTIFKEWFGKYQMGDELPEGWRVGTLGDVTKSFGGTTPSTKNPDFWDGNIHWSSPKDLSLSKSMFLLNTVKKITEEGLKKISSGLLPKRTLLLSSRAPVGYLSFTNIELAINQGYIALMPNQYFSNNYMYLWLDKNMKRVINAANGSTFLEISKTAFRNIECVIPKEKVLKEFDDCINPIFEKILYNLLEIKTLTKTRDTLLPKLMSGAIRVNQKIKAAT